MPKSRRSAAWLSDDMAGGLAAMCPPLKATDVSDAADELAIRTPRAVVASHLLGHGADLFSAQRILEALRALHDLGR